MWKQISKRKSFNAFFDKYAFQRYKTPHCNQSKNIIKKAGKVNDTDLVKEAIKSNKGKKRAKCQLHKERLAVKVAQDHKDLEMHEKNKSDNPDRLGDIFTNEWKTEMAVRR